MESNESLRIYVNESICVCVYAVFRYLCVSCLYLVLPFTVGRIASNGFDAMEMPKLRPLFPILLRK